MKRLMMYVLNILLHIFWLVPMKKNYIVFEAYADCQYACNPKYISEYLETHYPGKYKRFWVYKDKKKELDSNIEQLKKNSLRYCYYILCSKIIVVNTGASRYLPFRPSQIVLNTWHGGGAYKKNPPMRFSSKNVYFLSSSRLFEQYVLRGAFQFKGNVLNYGMPRNDLLFKDLEPIKNKVSKALQIKKKCVLYAPTWRKDVGKQEFGLDYSMLKTALENQFGGEWVVLKRLHHEVEKSENQKEYEGIIDVSPYPDMQELLAFADVLITDYSSSIWDFSFTYKPCFLYAADLEAYEQERDFYIPIQEWPFPLAQNNTELVQCIQKFNEEEYKKQVQAHHNRLGNYENGTACQQTVEFILQHCR